MKVTLESGSCVTVCDRCRSFTIDKPTRVNLALLHKEIEFAMALASGSDDLCQNCRASKKAS